MRTVNLLALLGLGFSGMAQALGSNPYLAELTLPVVVDSPTFQSAIYIDAVPTGEPSVAFRVTYYGGDDTSAPGKMDCGQHAVAVDATRKFSLRDFCPALPAGSHYGTLTMSTLGPNVGYNSIPRIRAYSRVQNYQGIGFSVEGIQPTYSGSESRVIGVKSGVDANGIRYQTNCFIGQHSENYWERQLPIRFSPGKVTAVLERSNGGYLDSVSVTVADGRLYRILDVFAASGQPDAFHDGVTVRFVADGFGQIMPFFAFCTVQENRNFSADFRLPAASYAIDGRSSQVIQPDGSYWPFFELVGSEVALFRPSGLSTDAINCFVDDTRMWIRVQGYYDASLPNPQVSETGRIRLRYGGLAGTGDIEVGLKNGEPYGQGYVMCLSGNGMDTLIRVR